MILEDTINSPISCQAYLESAANAVIGPVQNDGLHSLSPSGLAIKEFLTKVYS